MKTIQEILLELPDDVFKKAAANIINEFGDLQEKTDMSLANVLTCEFSWYKTPEWQEYWEKVVENLKQPRL